MVFVSFFNSSRKSFECFATNAAIRCTEVYEYSQTLGGKNLPVPSFQVDVIYI